MAGREFSFPSDEQVERDRELIEALDEHRPVGEKYAQTGEIPEVVDRQPSMGPSANAGIERDPTPVHPIPSPPRFVGRRIVQVLLIVALIGAAYYAVSLVQVWSTGRADQAREVQAIVVMGAAQYDGRPSPQLAARLDHVIDLWSDGVAPMVVVTGGNQPGDRFTEAEASRTYLVERGVPDSAIVAEQTGASTYESLANVAEILGESDEVLIVTDPYHALRSKLTAEEVGFTFVYVSPTPSSVVNGTREFRRQLTEAAGVGIGRIIGFERLSGLTD